MWLIDPEVVWYLRCCLVFTSSWKWMHEIWPGFQWTHEIWPGWTPWYTNICDGVTNSSAIAMSLSKRYLSNVSLSYFFIHVSVCLCPDHELCFNRTKAQESSALWQLWWILVDQWVSSLNVLQNPSWNTLSCPLQIIEISSHWNCSESVYQHPGKSPYQWYPFILVFKGHQLY